MRKEKICVSQSILLSMVFAACSAAPTALPPTATAVQSPTATATTTATAVPTVHVSIPTATTVPATATLVATGNLQGTWLTLAWYGQATFILQTSTGLRALLDPTAPGTGYKLPVFEHIDLVTTSHEHSDHNAVGLAAGNPLVLRGLAGSDWAKVDQVIKGVRMWTVGVYHDAQQGAQRGKNAIFVFDVDGLRLAHLGDLGHALSPEQIRAAGPLDVVLIPVGGYYTIDAKTAVQVIDQLKPRVVIPMHDKTPDLSPSLAGVLAPVDDFLGAIGDRADIQQAGQSLTIEKDRLPARLTVYVMKYKP